MCEFIYDTKINHLMNIGGNTMENEKNNKFDFKKKLENSI